MVAPTTFGWGNRLPSVGAGHLRWAHFPPSCSSPQPVTWRAANSRPYGHCLRMRQHPNPCQQSHHRPQPAAPGWAASQDLAKTPARFRDGSGCAFERAASANCNPFPLSEPIAQPRHEIAAIRGFGQRQGRHLFASFSRKGRKSPARRHCAIGYPCDTAGCLFPLFIVRSRGPLR